MDVHQVRCFVTVAEEAHFGRAAERLHLSPSPVSRAVKELERELGTELFIRRYHQIELTPAGQQLVPLAKEVLASFDNLKTVAHAARTNAPRVIHVGGTYLAPPALFDRVVALAEGVANGRPVDIFEAPSAELLPDVESGAIDIALVHLPVDSARLDCLAIARYRFMIVMRADDPLASASKLTLTDIAPRTFILGASKVQPLAMNRMRDYLVKSGITNIDQLPESDTTLIASHIRRNHGVTLALSPSNGGATRVFDDPAFALVPLADDGLDFTVGLAWRRDRAESDDDVAALGDAARREWSQGPDVY